MEFSEKNECLSQNENKYLHQFNLFFEKIILHTIEQITAAEQLLGNTFWAQLNSYEIEKLFQRLEGNHFSEVLFWNKSVCTGDLVPTNKKAMDISDSTLVFCVQQDHSMQPFVNLQLSLALTLVEFSKKFNYDFIYLPFADTIEQETVALKGALDVQKYFEMSEGFIGGEGAVHYKKALNFAFTLLKLELSSASGKICLLCNELLFEYLPTEEYWKNAVLKFKSEKDIEITVIYIGDKELLADIWFADQVVPLENLASIH